MNRRDAIKTLGALAGAAGAAKVLSACGDEPGEEVGGTIVFLMMENRSYDHYLGSRALAGLGGDGLSEGMSNPDRLGDDVAIWPATDDAQCIIDPPHGWGSSRTQFNGGANDGFLIAHQNAHGSDLAIEPMQYMLREHQPIAHALADAYTSCDRWFSSVMGPTLPNRMYWHAGTSNGARGNDEVLGGAYEGIPTLYHRLDAAGVDWAYYYGDVPVLSVLDVPIEGRVRRFMWDFIDDAAAGRLPPVVYIDPGFASNDDHPPHHPLLGQQLIAATYQALATSPQWSKSMLVVTYDEHGGFYDHVPPPADAADEHATDGFNQLGFRVPTLIAGPYVKQGHVSSVPYDHTSALKHLENVHGLEPLTARVSAASDLLDCIDLERLEAGDAAAPVELPAVEVDESQLPANCRGGSFRTFDHDILEWADANRAKLGRLDLRHEATDYVHGIAEYLDRHNLGRIRRGR